jgi:hypothetical protein
MIKFNKVTRDMLEAEKQGEYYATITFRRGMYEARISDDVNDRHAMKVCDSGIEAQRWIEEAVRNLDCWSPSCCIAWVD